VRSKFGLIVNALFRSYKKSSRLYHIKTEVIKKKLKNKSNPKAPPNFSSRLHMDIDIIYK
jgi:hypothetical protein